MNLIASLQRYRRCCQSRLLQKGVAAVEFALTLPIWVTFLLGVSDGTYCLLVNEKTDRIAYSVTDIVTQYQTITIAQLNDISTAASQIMQPMVFGNKGVLIITSIYKSPGNDPKICWQYQGGGALGKASKIGLYNGSSECTKGTKAELPNDITLNDNENIIVTEVYYMFEPMFLSAGLFKEGDVYRVAIYKPRLSPLITPPV